MSAHDKPTPLNFKKVTIEVSDGLVKEAGLFAASFISYSVRTDPLGYAVRRRDSDFALLRKIILRQFPNIAVPPCNGNPPVKFTPMLVKKKERYYTRFMQALVRCEEIKTSQLLLDFVFESDNKNWAKVIKEANDKFKAPRNLEEYVTSNGQARV